MSQDNVADILNQLMNARRAKKTGIVTTKTCKLLVEILKLMKQYGYIEYDIVEGKLTITIKEMSKCMAIKPRYTIGKKEIERYVRRFLPARNFGYVIISTSKGLMTHQEAQEKNLGGSLIAYFY